MKHQIVDVSDGNLYFSRPQPRRDAATLAQENRTLRGVAFAGVVLLAPIFTAGWAVGRLTAPVAVPEKAAVVSVEDQAAAPAPVRKSPKRKPAVKKPAPVASDVPADETASN